MNLRLLSRRLGISPPTVGKWRRRFVTARLDGLVDEPRPGRPRTVGDDRVEEVIVKTLETRPPDGGTHWSTRQMAQKTGLSLSQSTTSFGSVDCITRVSGPTLRPTVAPRHTPNNDHTESRKSAGRTRADPMLPAIFPGSPDVGSGSEIP